MGPRWVFHYSNSGERERIGRELDELGVPYRAEKGIPEDCPTLSTPGGRFRGETSIRCLIGKS